MSVPPKAAAAGSAEALLAAGAGSAAALLQRFEVRGRFREAVLDGTPHALRSHLDIRDRLAPSPSEAGLVAVMMNPGASRPLAPPGRDGWAPTQPDRTQYQLMRLMLVAQSEGWALTRITVLNLSDLRTPKSAELFGRLAALRDPGHSLFLADARARELERALGRPGTPVLRAWGMAPALEPLARRAIRATAGRPVLGLAEGAWRYRHPLPQRADLQAAWLAAMSAQVAAHARRSAILLGSPEGCPSG